MRPSPISDEAIPEAETEAAVTGEISRPAPSGRAAAFRALGHRNYRLYFVGQLISLIGTWMQSVAQAWLVLKLSDSALMLGVVAFASYMPILLVSLFAGVVIDHVDRRRLILAAQIMLMLSAFVLAALSWSRVVSVEDVIILAALNGLVSSFDMPGRQAFVVEMVGKSDLPNAIALNSMLFNGARAIGPAIAGLLIAVIGVTGCFFLNGLSFLAVIWSLIEMDVPRRRSEVKLGAVMLKQVRQGLAYVWRHRASFYLLLLVAITSGFAIQFVVLVPVFARDILHGGAKTYGFLLAAQGIGAATGAFIMAARSDRPRALRQNLVFGIFCMSFAIVAFGMSRWMLLSLAAEMLVGAGMMNFMATTNTLLQLFVPDELRGRVMSMHTLSFIGMAPLGSLEVGYIGQHVSPEVAVVICGIVSFCCGLFLLSRLGLIATEQEQSRQIHATKP